MYYLWFCKIAILNLIKLTTATNLDCITEEIKELLAIFDSELGYSDKYLRQAPDSASLGARFMETLTISHVEKRAFVAEIPCRRTTKS